MRKKIQLNMKKMIDIKCAFTNTKRKKEQWVKVKQPKRRRFPATTAPAYHQTCVGPAPATKPSRDWRVAACACSRGSHSVLCSKRDCYGDRNRRATEWSQRCPGRLERTSSDLRVPVEERSLLEHESAANNHTHRILNCATKKEKK